VLNSSFLIIFKTFKTSIVLYNLLTPNISSYELIDSGNYEKLERFGDFILARPEPQAVWDKSLSEEIWQRKASAIFKKTKGRDQLSPEERGEWHNIKKMPEKWFMDYFQGKSKCLVVTF
jgi:23S rRNA (cytosine1962-C5)-methyltransferase